MSTVRHLEFSQIGIRLFCAKLFMVDKKQKFVLVKSGYVKFFQTN